MNNDHFLLESIVFKVKVMPINHITYYCNVLYSTQPNNIVNKYDSEESSQNKGEREIGRVERSESSHTNHKLYKTTK